MQAFKVDVPATILQSLSKITDPGELKKRKETQYLQRKKYTLDFRRCISVV